MQVERTEEIDMPKKWLVEISCFSFFSENRAFWTFFFNSFPFLITISLREELSLNKIFATLPFLSDLAYFESGSRPSCLG